MERLVQHSGIRRGALARRSAGPVCCARRSASSDAVPAARWPPPGSLCRLAGPSGSSGSVENRRNLRPGERRRVRPEHARHRGEQEVTAVVAGLGQRAQVGCTRRRPGPTPRRPPAEGRVAALGRAQRRQQQGRRAGVHHHGRAERARPVSAPARPAPGRPRHARAGRRPRRPPADRRPVFPSAPTPCATYGSSASSGVCRSARRPRRPGRPCPYPCADSLTPVRPSLMLCCGT